MSHTSRLMRRPFYWLMAMMVAGGMAWPNGALRAAASPAPQSGPALTTVSDTVYRADGSPAQGRLEITWPTFIAAGGSAVAAGTATVTLGMEGQLSAELVPNSGSTPAGVYYTVVYQLNDGTVKTEFWLVPATSPANLAAVRTTPGSGTAAQPVSMQYVNTALANKANDSAVVHLSGAESITGAKTFATAPSVPSPVNTGDVANKSYVDASVATVGAGNFVASAGGTMTGPLTLSGNPTAPLQAAPRQCVDSSVAAKADLVSGTVPVHELASGTASPSSCLLGNGTWGACSSSTNAISIQSVAVASTAPADGQVITYSASAGQYVPQAGGGVTAGMQVVKWATDYNWSQSPSASLSTPGSQTVTLSACPSGVTGTEPYYYIYIAGTGTAEAALVTGGTCAGNGSGGTLQFTTVNAHGAGYAVGSASSGLQESSIAARFVVATNYYQGATVYAPAGEFPIYARVSFRSNSQTINMTHAIFDCYANDSCLFVGDPANANFTSNVTLIKPRGKPMVSGGTKAMIEVNGQATRLEDVATKAGNTGNTFGTIVQVDGDQSFTLDGLDLAIGLGAIACNATSCGAVVTAPGPFSANPAVGHLKNLNISPQCDGNGVDWQSGNTLEISDSVVQGYSQFGIRGGRAMGGFGNIKMVNVYEEGGCSNPTGNIGTAGVIVNGGPVFWSGGEGPQGAVPTFANTGSTQWQYYIVARHATFGPSNLVYAGTALTNGTGTITVTTADVAGAATFDLLKVQPVGGGALAQTPYGTGNYAVVTNVARGTACSGGVCTFTDTLAAPGSYTVSTPTYFPKLNFWPGGVVLGASADGTSLLSAATLTIEVNDMAGESTSVVSVLGTHAPAVFAYKCPLLTTFSPTWVSCVAANFPPETQFQQDAMVITNKPAGDGGLAVVTNLKGRLNFGSGGSTTGHIITLMDSNFQKTVATSSNRPGNDANDSYLGMDQGNINGAGLSIGSALSVSEYVGNVGDGTNWGERLTAAAKTFKVPVTINGNLTVTGTCTGCGSASGTVSGGSGSQVALYPTSGTTVSGDSGLTDNGTTLSYAGSGGVSASAGNFSGNLTVNGQLLVAGPWMVSSPIPGTAMGAAPAGNSALGISSDGNFYISANAGTPQKVATTATSSFFSGLAQEDADDVGEFHLTMTNPQNLHVYSSYTSSSIWQRTSLGYDATDNYAVVRSENSSSGAAPGLGFWINSGLKWVIDASNTFKPWTDQSYNIGSFSGGSGTGLRPGTIYAAGNSTSGSGFELGKFANESYELCNDTTNGTTVNGLAVLTAAGCAAKPGSALSSGAIGVVIANAGSSGTVTLARSGSVFCSFDGTATVIGDYVTPSSTASSGFFPLCHDAGATRPTGTQILGRVLQASAGSATVQMFLDMPGSNVSSAASAGTGSCTNQAVTAVLSGGPTCTTITSAYVDSSVASTSTLASGNYTKASGASAVADSGVAAGPYATEWITAYRAGTATAFNTSGTKIELWGVTLQFPLSTSTLTYNVSAADATSNTYDLGIYNGTGTLVAHTGAIAGSTAMTAGAHSVSWTGTNPKTLQPGKYYLAITTGCTASCATLSGDGSSAVVTFQSAGLVTTSGTQGTLDSSITAPADSYTWSGSMISFIVR